MSIALLRSPGRTKITVVALPVTKPEPIPEIDCALCGSGMESRPNRYFGSGLATHRFIAVCRRCDHVAFVPEPGELENAAPGALR
ncbi:MAG: hypothetical protein QOD27_1240 [Microbacteriaceae bacterium]|jgi:hypothetical protein|nr:hypothetical protein [Microbacteriaceae bacterium]MDQ1553015.1 hypothetical protein [Microbacteriaceae bacterium]